MVKASGYSRPSYPLKRDLATKPLTDLAKLTEARGEADVGAQDWGEAAQNSSGRAGSD